jgi:hypothetical protein
MFVDSGKPIRYNSYRQADLRRAFMRKCCICYSEITRDDPAILFVGRTGIAKVICSECEGHMDSLTEGADSQELRAAISYLGRHAKTTRDRDVAKFLSRRVIAALAEIESSKDAPAPSDSPEGSAWASGKKAVGWLLFFLIAIAGLILIATLGIEATTRLSR